jgi:hypothetical protein
LNVAILGVNSFDEIQDIFVEARHNLGEILSGKVYGNNTIEGGLG